MLSAISVFERVARLKSFTMAAKELGVSKAHISKLIQGLESDLGESLFHRSTRKVNLTLVGEGLYRECTGPLSKIERVREEILSSSKSPRGILRVSVAGAYGEDFIAPVLFDLLSLYPELKVELLFSTKNVDIIEESFDVAIRVGDLSDSKFIARRIGTRKEYICASSEYLKKNGTPKYPNEVNDHICLIGASEHWTFYEKKQQKKIKINSRFKSDNGRAILNGVRNHLGLAKLPDIYVSDYIKTGEIISVLEKYMPSEIPIWALTHTKKSNSVNLKAFLDLLK